MSQIDPSVKLYKGTSVQNSYLKQFVTVGDFSKVQNSTLDEKTRIDRNNHINSSMLGRYSYTGRNTVILHASIGAFCSISWNVSIGGANHDYSRISQHSFLYGSVLRPEDEPIPYNRFDDPVNIGHDVWIAAGAVIMRGVTIGDGAVIGANAVVTRDVPPYAIVVGSPAKVIKYRFEPEIIELLLQLKWWLWSEEKIKENFIPLSKQPDTMKLQELLKK